MRIEETKPNDTQILISTCTSSNPQSEAVDHKDILDDTQSSSTTETPQHNQNNIPLVVGGGVGVGVGAGAGATIGAVVGAGVGLVLGPVGAVVGASVGGGIGAAGGVVVGGVIGALGGWIHKLRGKQPVE